MSGFVSMSRSLARPVMMQARAKDTAAGKVAIRQMAQYGYRDHEKEPYKFTTYFAQTGGFLVATYIMLYSYFHSEHILGHYPTIEPSKWTDAELGIPPDEEDIYPPGYVPLSQR